MTNDGLDVLIVGAGPTGLTLAAELQQFGVRVRLIDRLHDRGRESRALAVQARSLELLQLLGLGERLVARGNTATRLKLHLEGRAIAEVQLGDIGAPDTRFPFILFVSQAETEALLVDHLHSVGLNIERGVELVAFHQRTDTVISVLRHEDGREERVEARFLVGCDGAHSTVRKGAGIPFEGGSYPQDFALGDVEADGPLQKAAVNSFVGAGGVAMFFPLGRPTTWRVIAMTTRKSETAQRNQAGAVTTLSLAALQAIVDPPTAGAVRLRDPAWLTQFHLHHRQTANYRKGNVFLAGDAAHIHSPVGAQGMNTGIQDAWNLAWKMALVARGCANVRLLDSYEGERWPVGQFLLRYTDRIFSTFTGVISARPLATWTRRAIVPQVVPRVIGSPWLRRAVFRFVSELGIRYRRSPVVEEGKPRLDGGPRAGDRLPDARLRQGGTLVYLQQAITGPHLALLLCGDPQAWDAYQISALQHRYRCALHVYYLGREADASENALVDRDGDAFTRLGVRNAAQYLVRPDGYVAYRCAGQALQGLEQYLAKWYVAATP